MRSAIEYEEWHMEQAINIPMATIVSNPMILEKNKDGIVLLYCQKGYKSEITARCLIDHGYESVFSFGVNLI